ncbi:MAG TPA: glycosyltransferase family 39 protein [Candidatus Binatia bacterium]|nr:glycosyltransferase family 39 protein [Candidatus Binatia bacterium]
MKPGHEAVVLVAACAVLYLTGLGDIPFYTRGEPREGLVVREMLRTGSWLVPARPEGEPARKPPLYYWLAATSLATLPDPPERALRLPSAIAAAAAVVGTWATARAIFGAPAALPAGLVLATTFEWTRAATSARVDMTLAASLTAVLAAAMLALERGGRLWLVVAAAGATLGTLAKGPVALVLPALAVVALAVFQRNAAPLRLLPALGVAGIVGGLWYATAFAREGSAFLDVAVRENWLRFTDAERGATGHGHGILYLFPLGLVGLLPWTPLLPLVATPLRPERRPAALFAAAWVVTGVVFFSAAAAKRSVYLLPLAPAVALLLGAGTTSGGDRRVARLGAAAYAPAALALAAVAGAVALGLDAGSLAGPWLRSDSARDVDVLTAAARAARPAILLVAVGTVIAATVVAHAAARGEWRRLVLVVAATFVVWTATFDAIFHPALARAGSLRSFFSTVSARVDAAPLYAFYPPDPGLRFYAPATLRRWPARGAPDDGHLLLWEDEWRRLRDESGRALPVLAVSEGRQGRRGHLALVAAPRGRLVPAAESGGRAEPPGLRTGSRPP